MPVRCISTPRVRWKLFQILLAGGLGAVVMVLLLCLMGSPRAAMPAAVLATIATRRDTPCRRGIASVSKEAKHSTRCPFCSCLPLSTALGHEHDTTGESNTTHAEKAPYTCGEMIGTRLTPARNLRLDIDHRVVADSEFPHVAVQ